MASTNLPMTNGQSSAMGLVDSGKPGVWLLGQWQRLLKARDRIEEVIWLDWHRSRFPAFDCLPRPAVRSGTQPYEPIEKFIRRWSPTAYGMTGALGTITTDEWPLLRDLPSAIKCKVLFANVMEYLVDGIEVPHAFIYTVEKKIYYMGKAPVFGIAADATQPRPVEELDGQELVAIHMGPHIKYPFAYAHATDGTIYTIGRGERGNLGHGDYTDLTSFKRVDGLNNIIQVSCGARSCTTLSIQCIHYTIHTFGDNERGQCGKSPSGPGRYFNRHQCISSLRIYMVPSFAACGLWHTVIGGHNGKLVSYGRNEEQQLGRACEEGYSAFPDEVSQLQKHQFKKVVCGWDHTLCLTEEGLLLSWGYNKHCQAGIGSTENVKVPKVINFRGKKVLDVIAVRHTSLAITDDEECFIWGRHNGKVIQSPQKIQRTTTPRDVMVKGSLVSTGGCVRIDANPWEIIECLCKENKELLEKNDHLSSELERTSALLQNSTTGNRDQQFPTSSTQEAIPDDTPGASSDTGYEKQPTERSAECRGVRSPMAKIMEENADYLDLHFLIDQSFLASLLQSGTLTQTMLEEVDAKKTQAGKRAALRSIIIHRGPKAPAAFMKALLISSQPHVIAVILKKQAAGDPNGAEQLLENVKAYFGDEVVENLRKIYVEEY